MKSSRRRFIYSSVGACLSAAGPLLPRIGLCGTQSVLGNSELYSVSDGHLSVPSQMALPSSIDPAEKTEFLQANQLNEPVFNPPCNLTLWKNDTHRVLFDVGAGPNFMPSAGKVIDDLSSLNIEPESITDVVFTHAHPDHIWGLVDDFDEMVFPNARYHMHAAEWDFWWDKNTVNTLPEAMQSMAVGARNRLLYLEDQINLFQYGDELLPDVEAIDTHGHTPGHTSFALHQGADSVVVLGDALIHPILSFEKAHWPWGSDLDQEAARTTRLALLDRLVSDQQRILGFHLPHPGLGAVERGGDHYRYVAA